MDNTCGYCGKEIEEYCCGDREADDLREALVEVRDNARSWLPIDDMDMETQIRMKLAKISLTATKALERGQG